jgi:hypothetical protein
LGSGSYFRGFVICGSINDRTGEADTDIEYVEDFEEGEQLDGGLSVFDVVNDGFSHACQARALDAGKAAELSVLTNNLAEFRGVH